MLPVLKWAALVVIVAGVSVVAVQQPAKPITPLPNPDWVKVSGKLDYPDEYADRRNFSRNGRDATLWVLSDDSKTSVDGANAPHEIRPFSTIIQMKIDCDHRTIEVPFFGGYSANMGQGELLDFKRNPERFPVRPMSDGDLRWFYLACREFH